MSALYRLGTLGASAGDRPSWCRAGEPSRPLVRVADDECVGEVTSDAGPATVGQLTAEEVVAHFAHDKHEAAEMRAVLAEAAPVTRRALRHAHDHRLTRRSRALAAQDIAHGREQDARDRLADEAYRRAAQERDEAIEARAAAYLRALDKESP